MFATPTNFLSIKRESDITLDDFTLGSAPADHFRLRVYKLLADGLRTLVFTSDTFTTAPVVFSLQAANAVPSNEIGVESGEYYQLELVEFDAAETSEDIVDEHFLLVFPDSIETVDQDTCGTLDSAVFDKLLYMLGHNVLHGEFDVASGYVGSRVIRGYETMTEAEATALLADSDEPDDSNVVFKSQAILTTADNGNELRCLETEQSV